MQQFYSQRIFQFFSHHYIFCFYLHRSCDFLSIHPSPSHFSLSSVHLVPPLHLSFFLLLFYLSFSSSLSLIFLLFYSHTFLTPFRSKQQLEHSLAQSLMSAEEEGEGEHEGEAAEVPYSTVTHSAILLCIVLYDSALSYCTELLH